MDSDVIVSNASCTTNCLAPVTMILDRELGIRTGYMTTAHAFTGDQPSHDTSPGDLYCARAASVSIVPTSTGAARAISVVLPQFKGRLGGSAVRVPTSNVSVVDLVEEINASLSSAAEGELAGILAYEAPPLVSADFNHDPHFSCVPVAQTTVTEDGLVHVVRWYDQEWVFANRMIGTGRRMGDLLRRSRPLKMAS